MRVHCPFCSNTVEWDGDESVHLENCPKCGKRLTFLSETATYSPKELQPLGHFQLLLHVGTGHFGEVFKALDTQLGRVVALKVPRSNQMDDATREWFLREARAAAKLRHPNIIAVHEVGMVDGRPYIAADFIDGPTLAECLASRRLSLCEAAEICAQVADALEHAHQAGVVHRDLKPANILLDSTGRPYVTDFGIAKQDSAESTVTAEGVILGTPAYMSPEQACGGSRHADSRSDVFSLGVVLYELLTGSLPFQGSSWQSLFDEIQHREPIAPRRFDRRIPRDLETICLTAIAKQPERRYASAKAMAEDLRRFLNGKPILARRVGRLAKTCRWLRCNPLSAVAAAIVGLFALGVMFWGYERWQSSQASLQRICLETVPSGAKVTFFPLDEETWEPLPDQGIGPSVSPLVNFLKGGDYLIVAYLDDGRFHEVFRHVPTDETESSGASVHRQWSWEGGSVILPKINIPPLHATVGMAYVPGGETIDLASLHSGGMPIRRRIPAFFVDPTELTVGQVVAKGKGNRFTGCLEGALKNEDALVCLTFNEAVALAEERGKRLPSIAEYELLAHHLSKSRQADHSEQAAISEWEFGPAGADCGDRLDVDPRQPIFGLYSNVAEWTLSRMMLPEVVNVRLEGKPRRGRIVFGGSPEILARQSKISITKNITPSRVVVDDVTRKPGLGLRCVRSVRPRVHPEDFYTVVSP